MSAGHTLSLRGEVELDGLIGEDGLHLEVAAESFDVLAQGAHVHVGTVLDLRDFALSRFEPRGYLHLVQPASAAQIMKSHLLKSLGNALLDTRTALGRHALTKGIEVLRHKFSSQKSLLVRRCVPFTVAVLQGGRPPDRIFSQKNNLDTDFAGDAFSNFGKG